MTTPRLARRHRDNATFGISWMSCCIPVVTTFCLESTLQAQEVRVRADGVIMAAGENFPNKIDRDTAMAQVRGLVQNELRILARTCDPTESQSRTLLTIIEEEWRTKSAREVAKRLQSHVHGTIDFDGIVERSMQDWVAKTLLPEQSAKYEEELSNRLAARREALIEQMLVWLHDKLQLSSGQQESVRKVLEEKWKDRWFRSIEGVYDNETLLPELNRSWLDTILTEAQRNALAIRTPLQRSPSYSLEYPVHPLDAPLRLGNAISDPRRVSPTQPVPSEPSK
ncbi:hypothetical protein VN12_15455 [Pirellula sp. SH-Sr6A]|uniref:hypothetical protein n=1 Tax=Pirellula sp. SH-Sr6A TaxID=1632865 RepID=UPI00078E4417|nr:hypothetical protein [Pirellula sp. SH-Sr6A]AMV33523.1 hypothetical protein VN12_15455 [Pirellula sp. SH-Sr6A]